MLRARFTDVPAIRLGIGSLVLTAMAVAWLRPAPVSAQAAPAATAAGKKLPAPEEISLTTKDGLELAATFFPGTRGKETVPVILVHSFKGSQTDYQSLALSLQKLGHAVLAVDLRGHGGSKKFKGADKPLDPDTMSADQFVSMVTVDMERFKKFLLEKHNAGELNIELLCVVGAEMGAIVASEWAARDWAWPALATGKQGQDARALVLISPVFAVKHLRLSQTLSFQPVLERLSVLILVGKGESKSVREAQRLYNAFKKFHRDVPSADKKERQDLFFGRLDTSLQGSKLLGAKGLNVEKLVADFIDLRLVNKAKEYPWKQR